MIPLRLIARTDAAKPFVTRLASSAESRRGRSRLERYENGWSLWCGEHGLLEIQDEGENLEGDIILVEPNARHIERLIRRGSRHNTLLVTEQCDQLCIMCSQPPKKTHLDRFKYFTEACLLSDEGMTIGVSGGEPTLHMSNLLNMVETVAEHRPDLSFHILSNAQHFGAEHVERLKSKAFANVVWGVPLYSYDPADHDLIVGKLGAFERLLDSLSYLLLAGARVELRTVLLAQNAKKLEDLAVFVGRNLPHIEQWSLMGLENAGFARARFDELRVPLPERFSELSQALDRALLHGVPVRLFNIPLCHVPPTHRHLAVASISDWKQRFGKACGKCSARKDCSGFFEWHPEALVEDVQPI